MTLPASRSLADDYELLRTTVVEHGRAGGAMQGRALLMFRGMANWMKCVAQLPSVDGALPVGPTQDGLRLPAGIEQNLISLVATMMLTNAREGLC